MSTRNYEDYTNYKKALNAAKTEIRNCKRNYQLTLVSNI